MKLTKNSTLELRNPENLAQQGINTLVSIHFRTMDDGLIMYLGNEVGTPRRMRRVIDVNNNRGLKRTSNVI